MSSALLRHVWGVSPAADRVWAQASGLPPSQSDSRLFMVLQAFIDDSYDDGATYVLAGHIASAESWAQFSKEWEQLLRTHGTLSADGHYHFKMNEMAQSAERLARVPAFYRTIERHALCALSCSFNIADLQAAKARVFVPGVNVLWGNVDNAFATAFRLLMDMFHYNRHRSESVLPLTEKIDFYFDEQSEKKMIIASWDNYMEAQLERVRGLYGSTPRFENDREFLPLQAADMWAWWVRKWTAEGAEDKLANADFGEWRGSRVPFLRIVISFTEDQLFNTLAGHLSQSLPEGAIIIDRKTQMVFRLPPEIEALQPRNRKRH